MLVFSHDISILVIFDQKVMTEQEKEADCIFIVLTFTNPYAFLSVSIHHTHLVS